MDVKKKKHFRQSTFGAMPGVAGYLEKRSSGLVKQWQKRYFAVRERDGCLVCAFPQWLTLFFRYRRRSPATT
jgi:hypothetical protein